VTLRLPADIHREAVARARTHHISLNEYLIRAIGEVTGVQDSHIGARHHISVYDDEGNKIGVV
jgi:hypothetical protein